VNQNQSEAMYRAESARRVMDDPMVREALETIKAVVRDQVFDLPSEAIEQREKLVMLDKMRQQFERFFEIAIHGGEVARYELDMERNTQTRLDAIREKARSYGG